MLRSLGMPNMGSQSISVSGEMPLVTPSATLGERVRAARRERGLSQAQLAGAELTKGFISQVESGLVRPSLRSLQVLANRLGKSLDYFLGDQLISAAKRATFHMIAAQAAAERANWDEVRSAAGAALQQDPTPAERAKALRLTALADHSMGAHEAAFDRVQEGLAILQPAVDPTEYAQLLYIRAMNYSAMGQLVAATDSYEAARKVLDEHEVSDPRLRARILVALGTMYRRLHRTTKAMSAYDGALALASRSSELALAARGYMGVAVSLYDSGELDGAIGNYERALELFERVSDTSFELMVTQSLAAVHLEQGDTAAARDLAQRALDRGLAVGDDRWAAVAEVVLARVALAEGHAEDALASATHAERILGVAADDIQRADALRVIGAAHDALGDAAGSERSYHASLAILESIGDQADLSAVAAEFAQKLRARGKLDEAFDMLERSHGAAAKH